MTAKDKIIVHNCPYTNDLDLLDKVLNIYSMIELSHKLTKQQRTILRFYLQYGFTSKVKEKILNAEKMNVTHLNQMNFQLKRAGYLEDHPTNQKMKVVAPKLLQLKNDILETDPVNRAKGYLIIFKKTE